MTVVHGQMTHASVPVRVLHRFTKPDGHVAEIRERLVLTPFAALECLVFIDGQLSERRVFYGERVSLYGGELEARREQFRQGGWVEDPAARAQSHLTSPIA